MHKATIHKMYETSFETECGELYNRFRARGYRKKVLHRAYARANMTPLEDLLVPKRTPRNEIIRCIGTFDVNNNRIRNILAKYWPVLTADEDLKTVITPHPSITYRKGKRFRDSMVHSFLQTDNSTWLKTPTKGSFPCGNCIFCSYMVKSKSFVNPGDGKEYHIREFINCRTTGMVYAAKCGCEKIYVGKNIQPLKRRARLIQEPIHPYRGTFVRIIRETPDALSSGVSPKYTWAKERATLTKKNYKKRRN